MVDAYIKTIFVDLWNQEISLEWTGGSIDARERGPFLCSPGAGISGLNCDNEKTSRTLGTKCTPKGDFPVLAYQDFFPKFPNATLITLFQSTERGIALHYYPTVPRYPASNGCVRIAREDIARLIKENTRDISKDNPSIVSVRGELRPKLGILQFGDRGIDVSKVQRKLIEEGYALKDSDDGIFGINTEQSLIIFQQDKSLNLDDGIFGPETYAALFP